MKSRRGIALLASLIILAVVAMVGVGAYFMSGMNLRIAGNTRSHVVARYNAETGVDTALVIAARAFRDNNGVFPTPTEFADMFPQNATGGGDLVFQLEPNGFKVFGDDEASVSVRGLGPNGARYVAEARFRGVGTPVEVNTTTNPLFGVGFVTNGGVEFPGNSTLDLNVWAGTSIKFPGGQSRLGKGYWARTAGPTGTECTIGKTRCETNAEHPNVTAPDFTAQRQEVIATYRELHDPSDDVPDAHDLSDICTERITSSNTSRANLTSAIVCLGPGVTLTLTGSVKNVVIIGDVSNTVRLLANTSSLSADGTGLGVTIVAGTVDLSDKNSTMSGENTIIAKSDITFNKGVTSVDENARTLISTEGDILLNGNGGRDIYATFWTGGTYRINGTQGDFVGSVVSASGTIAITGNGGVDHARLPDHLINPFVPTVTTSESFTDAGILVLSRR